MKLIDNVKKLWNELDQERKREIKVDSAAYICMMCVEMFLASLIMKVGKTFGVGRILTLVASIVLPILVSVKGEPVLKECIGDLHDVAWLMGEVRRNVKEFKEEEETSEEPVKDDILDEEAEEGLKKVAEQLRELGDAIEMRDQDGNPDWYGIREKAKEIAEENDIDWNEIHDQAEKILEESNRTVS